MFSRSEFCLHLGLNPNDEDVRASSQRLFARVPWHPRHACVPYFVCERGSYVPSPVSGAVPEHLGELLHQIIDQIHFGMDLTKQKQGLLLFVTQFFWATEKKKSRLPCKHRRARRQIGRVGILSPFWQ